ncbi:GTA-gp10 family protein [Paracoccus cavernae]|uniref:GTA-gp10 family protein n=1 Tax=Paracoccus cavernae TaxID=1571207 RepID=UPI0035F40BBC
MDPAVLNWPCGEDPFLLRIGELEALDDLTAEGVLDLRWRLAQGAHRGSLAYAPVKVREVIACLRLGLIGAGMDRATAERKSRQAFEEGDIGALNLIAFTILSNAFAGKEHDPVGEAQAGEVTAKVSVSASPASTAMASHSGSRRPKSKK